MLPARHCLSSLSWTLAVATSLAACVLDPKSTGELDDSDTAGSGGVSDTTPPVDGATSVATDGDDEGYMSSEDDGSGVDDGPGEPPDVDCTDEACTTPAVPLWSTTFPTSTHTWACDVAVDSTGRIALAWLVEPNGGHPQGWTGIRLYDPSGVLIDEVDVEGEIFGALAFASDDTLRVRGATALGGNQYQEWARALDSSLQPAWTQLYGQQGGWGQCGWGSRGLAVSDVDQVVTYEYICDEPYCPQSFVRRHAPDGALLWEQNPGGNPGAEKAPIALGSGQSAFHGAVISWDDYDEVEIRKYAGNGTELWTTVILGEISGMWGAADGGVFAATDDLYTGERRVHRLAPDGTYTWVSGPADGSVYRVAAPTSDELGLYALAQDGLRRTSLSLQTQWTATIEYASPGWASADAIRGDDLFVFAGSGSSGGNDVWLTVLAAP
ncbi:MAG: hypothetical protein KDK70_11080 [Myxococcales bacterium]|nr:hypothetical protein [Myxococcales bacterium]